MKIGLYGLNTGACADPDVACRVARAAEQAGFESLWTAEHVVLPEPQTPESPIPASTPLLDPAVVLARLAAETREIRLATGIIILPQRNPVVLAKEMASLDVVSGGRLIFGIGAGYIPLEFASLGVPFDERGKRTDEYIEIVRTLWTAEKPTYNGDFFQFDHIDAHPRPLQRPHPPIVVGGMSPPALRRAVRQGDGWYGFALDLDATATIAASLREIAERGLRPESQAPLEITITPSLQLPTNGDTLRRFEDLGVDRLAVLALGATGDDVLAFVDRAAEALISKQR
jgi:probable F420-dependent oxidoreductase